ncbi:hypothetical protein [Chitinophaga sp. Cy-1792]|uniref:hypothetical protein n=1 Tax=Chitinophaga sp. Cy-1792 TaxID=2608339 RepID=UPI00141EAFF4|nr:hypothetical protein [Chitinophaga sp. Cy-1792]NIG53353.1 hypothetical protein [Chitinophaga sp. Cy-1792]
MSKKLLKRITIPLIAVMAVISFSSFTGADENNYGTCNKVNDHVCKITAKDGTTILDSTGAWTSN